MANDNNLLNGTQGHEDEKVSVEGLKWTLQDFKDDLIGIPNKTDAINYTQAEADAYNALLTGALDSTTPLTAEQAEAYNQAVTGASKEAGDTLSESEANAYNATLDGAVSTSDIKTPAVPQKVKEYVDSNFIHNTIEITSLSADYTFVKGDTLMVGTGVYRCTAASTTLPPFNFVFDANGSIVIDVINGEEAVVADSDTLNTGWEKVAEISDRHYTEMRILDSTKNKADKATTLAGYNIGDAYTKTQVDALTRHTRLTDFDLNTLKKAVADQNLEKYGLKVGDQKTINGRTYVIADLNTMKGTAARRVNVNHVGLVVIPHTTQAWNASGNTYTGADNRGAGYANCDLHYYLVNTLLPLVKGDLGATNMLAHFKIYSNAVNTTGINKKGEASGCSSGWGWVADQYISALSEVQVYGSTVWSSSGYDTGEACRQLEVFQKYSHTEIFGSEYPWLRDVVSASNASYSDNNGSAEYTTVSYAHCVAALVLFH